MNDHNYSYMITCQVFLSAAVPIVFVVIPFFVDMANGRDDTTDIIVQRAKMKDEIS